MATRLAFLFVCTLPLLLLGLVRFTNFRINYARKTIVNYDKQNRQWIFNQPEKHDLSGEDGPYLFWRGDSLEVVQVNEALQIQKKIIKPDSATTFTTYVANKDRDQFSFRLQPNPVTPPATYTQPKRMLAISDIEGNFNAFYSLLVGNGVIDQQYRWTYGAGHLVLVGDFVDRGDNVTQCLWLIYKLEQEALKQGGQVHYILGNHEVMNLENDLRYVNRKYLALAQHLSGKTAVAEAFPYLMSDENVLVQWMRTKNTIEKIGDVLYVHGGISPELMAAKLSIEEINQALHSRTQQKQQGVAFVTDDRSALVIGGAGPLWYRGFVKIQEINSGKTAVEVVNQALRYFKVKKIVIGHTLVEEVSADYNGKVLRIDIRQPTEKNTGKAQALLIEGSKTYRVNDLGERVLLKR